jgi:hypothetical protein
MQISRKAKASVILLSLLVSCLFFLLKPLSESVRITGPVAGNEVGLHNENPEAMQLWFQPQSFDPVMRKAKFNLFAWTNDDDEHFSSSMISPRDYWLFVDELYGKGSYHFLQDEPVGAVAFEADVLSIPTRGSRANDFFYPFDSYVLDAYAGVSQSKLGDDGIPVFEYFYETSLPDFKVTYTRIAGWEMYDMPGEVSTSQILAERESGQVSFLARFDRSLANQLTIAVIIIIWMINTISLLWITQRVLTRSRPPSIQVLVWSAASVLGYVQLRESLPGSPRLGIAIDYLFYFPALIVSVAVALVITISWSNRSDFSL